MTALLRQRARIVRVRRIQHNGAATAAADAAGRVQLIEGNRERLSRMRGELRPAEGPMLGAALARMSELAMRLDDARFGLGVSLDAARAAAAAKERARLTARRDQEGAEKLQQAAAVAANDLIERRQRLVARRPNRLKGEQA